MSSWRRPLTLTLVLALSSVGCAGYRPVRWPRSDLWSPSPSEPSTIRLPSTEAADYAGRIQKENVSVAVELIDPQRATQMFHADLVRHGVQPLMVAIHNSSDQTYVFRKANVAAHRIPARKAAQWACVHPVATVAQSVRWLAFLVPGLIVESIVEPASTLDFTGIEEAARRPPATHNQAITADFVAHEIADAEIFPDHDHAGILFIRPPKLGGILPVTLINASTSQSLRFEIPTPPPVYAESHDYAHPYDTVWNAAVKSAERIASWRVVSTEKAGGVIAVRKGLPPFTRTRPMTITVKPLNDRSTRVTIQTALRRATSTGLGERSLVIPKFFEGLAHRLPAKKVSPPPPPLSPVPPASPRPSPVGQNP